MRLSDRATHFPSAEAPAAGCPCDPAVTDVDGDAAASGRRRPHSFVRPQRATHCAIAVTEHHHYGKEHPGISAHDISTKQPVYKLTKSSSMVGVNARKSMCHCAMPLTCGVFFKLRT